MKVDANDHAVYLVDEKQGVSGTTPRAAPAVPSPQPRIYPADSSAPSGRAAVRQPGRADQVRLPAGGAQHDAGRPVSSEPKPAEPPKKPDKYPGNETTATHPDSDSPDPDLPVLPGSSVLPPSGNSLQFKVGGLISAAPSLMPRGEAAPTGSVSRPGLIQRSNRAGHLSGLLIGGVSKTIRDAGGVAHAKDKDETKQAGLQLGKDIANGIATGIDLSMVPHKKEMKSSFFSSPHRQGVYEVPHHAVDTGAGAGIVLTNMRNAPQDHGTQTVQPGTRDVGTQPAPVGKSDTGTQVQPNQSVGQTQARTPTRSQESQATPQAREAAVQTTLPTHAGTQTPALQVPAHDEQRSPQQQPSQPAPNDPRKPPSASNSHQTTQTAPGVSRRTATQAPGQTDAGVQVSVTTNEHGGQHAPLKRPASTQTAVQPAPADTPPPRAVPVTTEASEQTDQTHAATDSQAGTKATTATQAGPARIDGGMQTDAGTTRATQHRPKSHDAATQSRNPATHTSATQHAPVAVSVHSQTHVKSGSAETQTGADNSKHTQTRADGHEAGTQTPTHTGEAATQAGTDNSDKAAQSQPQTTDRGTQTPAPAAVSAKQGSGAAGQSAGSAQGMATQTPAVHADGAGRGGSTVPASVKGNGHWVLADGVSLASDINNVKKHPTLTNIAGVGSTAVLTVGDTIALSNAGGSRVLTLASRSLSLLGTTIGLAPSVGQLASDVKQLIANPQDEQSKWNVGNSAFQLGAGLAATAASLVFPPAALLPIVFPNFAEIGHAEILRGKKNELNAEGLKIEAAAVEGRYKIAALDATPLINWFSTTYTPELRPVIENFEMAQGNKPGGKPAGELPVNTLHDPRVYDYYGAALAERANRLANAAQGYLKSVASGSGLSSVTMVSRCPQVFGWPTNGQAMRVFDRAVAITYDSARDTVHSEFFGQDKDGTYRLPTRDPSLPSGESSKNLVFYTDMLDPDAKHAQFDLPQYRADPGTFSMDVRKNVTAKA
jgi:hypothetical protein